MTEPVQKAPYDADPQPATWRGGRDRHLQRHAAEQFAVAWKEQGEVNVLLRKRAEIERELRAALDRREDALAVSNGLRFSDSECVSTLRTIRKEGGWEDYRSPDLLWLDGDPVPFKPDVARPRPTTWDGREPQRVTGKSREAAAAARG